MVNEITTAQAIKSLDSTAEFTIYEDVITWITTPISDSDITTEQERLQAEYDSQAYARSRETEYPQIGDQLDDLFHKGAFSTEMAATLQAVKDKYPKP